MLDPAQLEKELGLPPGLLSAQMQAESGGNPNAISPAGAIGLMQFMPETAKQYGIDPTNPDQSLSGAARMDADLLKKYGGDVPSALAAYNWGQGNVDRKGLQNAPTETQNYITKIMGAIGNAIVPSANASEMPNDLSHLSDDQLKQIANGSSALSSLPANDLGSVPWGATQAVQSQELPDLSQVSDEQLQAIASGQQANGNPMANGEQSSPNNAQPNSAISNYQHSQNPILDKLNSLVAETPEDNYYGFIPMGKELARGALGLMQDVSGHGQVPGSNLNPEEINAVASLSPVSEMALKGVPGIAGKSVIKSAEEALPSISTPKNVPASSADFKDLANQAYAKADEAGGVLKPEFTDKFIEEAKSVAPQTAAGKIVSGENSVTKLVDRMQGLKGKPLSLAEAQDVDEALGGLIDQQFGVKGLSKEGKSIYDLQTKFRDMMNDAVGGGHVAGGTKGFEAWKEGQQLWSQSMAMRDVEKVIARAQDADNPAIAIKNGFKALKNNDSRMRGFRPDEKKAIAKAAKTGLLTDALRIAGSRLNPIGSGIAGTAVGGPLGGLASAATSHVISSIARAGATKIQSGKAQKVLDTIAKRKPKTR